VSSDNLFGHATQLEKLLVLVLRRVTRFGDFSPIKWPLTFGSFLCRSSPKYWATLFPRYKLCVNFDKKRVVPRILGDFSQTHLVTRVCPCDILKSVFMETDLRPHHQNNVCGLSFYKGTLHTHTYMTLFYVGSSFSKLFVLIGQLFGKEKKKVSFQSLKLVRSVNGTAKLRYIYLFLSFYIF
jgi:hypothetical protein